MSKSILSDPGLRDPLNKVQKTLSFSFEIKNNTFQPRGESERQLMMIQDEGSRQDGAQHDYSQEESDKQHEKVVRRQLKKEEMKENIDKKVVVGTGFSMDVTDFFTFGKRKQLGSKVDIDKSWYEEISGGRLAWIILLWSVTTGAIIPGWIMNIPANKILRLSWRFVLQVPMMIPFVLYQYRNASPEIRKQYQVSYIFKPSNIIKPLASSLSNSFWFTMICFGFEWTLVSHSIVLGSLSNLFLSLDRSKRQSSHDLQNGGQILVLMGVGMVMYDTINFDPNNLTPEHYNVKNQHYYSRQWWERLAFDTSAFFVSFIMSRFSQYTSDLKSYYPPFLSMLLVNTFNAVHMAFSSFFLHGCSFTFDSFWGIWSIFSDQHFAGFMYMAIVLFMGQMVSILMVTRMFPDPIIPALALTLEPFFTTFFLHVANIQRLPDSFTLLGYLFLVPGLCLILVGQYTFQRINAKKQEESAQKEDRREKLQAELQEIQQRKKQRQKRSRQRAKTVRVKHGSESEEQEIFSQ